MGSLHLRRQIDAVVQHRAGVAALSRTGGGTPVVSAGVGGVRAVRLDVRVGASAVVTVTCTHSGHDPATATATFAATPAGGCGDPLGTLGVGSVTRSGTIAADAACISPQRVRDGGDAKRYWARRHTFTLAAPAKVTVDAGSPTRRGLDAYVVLLEGHSSDGTGTVAGRDNNSGPRRDARLAALALPAGDYTVEVTTAGKRRTGNYRLQVTTAAAPTACTDDLGTLAAGRYTRTGTITDACVSTRRGTPTARPGARWHTFTTVSEPFTVSPSTAACTAAPAAASVTAGSGRRRTVSATIDAPGPLPVTVTCTAAGRGPARQQATLTHAGALTTITARAAGSGGECETARTRRGIDAAYRCRIGRGNTVTIAADAVATGPGIEIAWATTGAITATGHRLGAATPTFGPDNSIAAWKRTASVDLACTSGGTATAKATLAGTTAKKTARLTVVCADAVQITGLEDASAEGTGTVAVTRGFTVTPPSAECSADPAAATVTEGVGGARTLSARVAVPATLEAVVTCEADGYADAVRRVALTARRPCSTHLGTLATGTVTLSGTITKGQCAAKARRTATESVFYAQGRHWAKRHTFTLDTPGWVTISLDNAPANAEALDTYLVLLKDDGNTGTPVARNDNRSRNNKNARLTGVFLRPGRYTIEATTKTPRTAGDYDLGVQATASGLRTSYTATVGAPKSITFNYWPPHAEVAVRAAAAEEFGLTIAADRSAGYGTATVALTPRLVHGHELTVRVSSDTTHDRTVKFKLTAKCPTAPSIPNGPGLTLTTSPHNGVLCIRAGTSDDAPAASTGTWGVDYRYEVTPGALNGIRASAEAALAARSDRRECGLTVNKLAAYLLAVGHHEIRATHETRVDGGFKHAFRPRTPARSAMSLGRGDHVGEADGNVNLYSGGKQKKLPHRAFFHAGVGWWQIDDRGEWPGLNHGERSDTGLGLNGTFDSATEDEDSADSAGEAIAEKIAGQYCDNSDGDVAMRRLFRTNTWYGCLEPVDGCHKSSGFLYLDSSDDLYVTIGNNRGDYSSSGGVKAHRCRWNVDRSAEPVACFFHDPDPERREGWLDDWAKTTTGMKANPLAAPFISFTDGPEGSEKRFGVFPGKILGMFESGTFETHYNAVPRGEDARAQTKSWSSGSYNLGTESAPRPAILEVEVCDEPEWVSSSSGPCRWHSVEDEQFADAMNVTR
ncbi:hypothetical protein [Candidatus Poriferisodalis sp.]|uniref:hypothetical protein n=1 Tax=Candidatus Poriferisodalis sp. TaxID=3101277 RepID=UPI003B0271C3